MYQQRQKRQNQKPDVTKIWPIRSEFFWSHVKEQLILGRGTVENITKLHCKFKKFFYIFRIYNLFIY